MLRSLLFIPGNNPAMLQNADVFGADAIILDLEDAVAATEKDAARDLVAQYLKTWRFKDLAVMVRVNGAGTADFKRDVDAVVGDALAAIVFPKADVESLADLVTLLGEAEDRKGLKRKTAIVPIVETAKGILEADGIAAMPRVVAILLGAEDLTAEMEMKRTKAGAELAFPRARIAFACKAARIEAIDTPFTDVNDNEGLENDAKTARALGFLGKAVIHPNQIEAVHRAFAPEAAEIQWARRVRAAAAEAKRKRQGAFSLDGKMIDKPVIERAERILKRAVRYGLIGEHDEE